ncbi:hypothetical protein Enr17x_13310 [Gimesia fumaroli]|uniref:Uncharacterized protein n=1 Tax=Gimesia fumaroli TaxID=2527976 RepID=A0A518I8D6_9PLAN|nr:hypothetical protein Enr17x_13310 [Gimesia fumaroli]
MTRSSSSLHETDISIISLLSIYLETSKVIKNRILQGAVLWPVYLPNATDFPDVTSIPHRYKRQNFQYRLTLPVLSITPIVSILTIWSTRIRHVDQIIETNMYELYTYNHPTFTDFHLKPLVSATQEQSAQAKTTFTTAS